MILIYKFVKNNNIKKINWLEILVSNTIYIYIKKTLYNNIDLSIFV